MFTLKTANNCWVLFLENEIFDKFSLGAHLKLILWANEFLHCSLWESWRHFSLLEVCKCFGSHTVWKCKGFFSTFLCINCIYSVPCSSVKSPLKLNDIQVVLQHTLSKDDLFFRKGLAYFKNTMPNHILHVLQQCGSVVKSLLVLNWPDYCSDLPPIEK